MYIQRPDADQWIISYSFTSQLKNFQVEFPEKIPNTGNKE